MKKRETGMIRWVTKIAILFACVGTIFIMDHSMASKSYAYTQTTGKVLSSNVKVRAEANTASEAIAGASSGASVTITDEVTAADGKIWYQVSVDGKTGYIRSDLLEKAGSAAESNATTAKTEVTATDKKSGNVLKDSVRVRKEANTGADVVATVGRGVALTVEGEAKGTDGKTWYSVSFSYNGKTVTGFIRSDFITFEALPEEEPEVTEITGNMGEGEEPAAGTEPMTEGEETPQTEQQPEQQSEQPEQQQQPGQYQLLNVEEVPKVPSGYTEIQLKWNEEDIKAWKNGDFYIFYARANDGTEGWYRFDSVGGTYQRYDAQLETGKGGLGSTPQMIIIIVLGVVVVILIVVVTLLLMKLNDYKISEQWDDDEEEDEDADVESARKERAKKTWRTLNFLSTDEDEDEDDDEDDEFDEIDYEDDDEEEELPIRTQRRPQPPQRPMGQTPVRRPAPQQQVTRPTGAPTGQGQAPVRRPAPQQQVTRPTGAPTGQGQAPVRRPAPQQGTRPTGAPTGQGQAPVRRPAPQQGTRPTGAPAGQGQAPVRRPAPQQGTRPTGAPTGQGQAPVRRPMPQQGNRPTRQPIRPEKFDD